MQFNLKNNKEANIEEIKIENIRKVTFVALICVPHDF